VISPLRIAGCIILTTACRPEARDAASSDRARPAWRLEVLAEAAPAGGFVGVSSLAADDSGNVYVADKGAYSIRVFDSAGREVRTIGRQGAGPGEFTDLYSIAWAGDTLAAYDPGNSRLQLVTRNGQPVGAWAGSRITGSDVRLFQSGRRFFMPTWRPAPDGKGIELLLVTPGEFGPSDTLRLPRKPDSADPTVVVCNLPGRSIGIFDTPFSTQLVSSVSPAGELVLTRNDQYRIAFLDPGGNAQRFTLYGTTPVPISSAEWDSVTAEYRDFRAKHPNADCDRDGQTKPEARPVLRSIEFDDEGRMWVEATVPGGYNFHVYDAAGGMLANIPAPARDPSVPFVVRDGRLHLVVESESGEQLVRTYRIRQAPGA